MKKEEMRFSIRFNPADPRHRNAARLLNEAGRSKAVIVANALWEYDFKRDTPFDARVNTNETAVFPVPITAQGISPGMPDDKADELEDAVLSGLSQFRMD